MYPHVRQLETRRGKRVQSTPQRERAGGGGPAGPPRYKLALLTWAAAYAVITLLLALLGPAMSSWPLALRTLVLSVTMVVALTWLVMPRLTRLLRPWLSAGA